MARELVPGTVLDLIAQSDRRWPKFRALLHNPRCTTINQVATDTYTIPPLDITAFVESVTYNENIGFENLDNPSTTKISLVLRRHPETGAEIRRGLIEDGVIIQLFTGDLTVAVEDWICVFTGTFRGRPGDDPGTPADNSEGLTAVAHGREERYLNLIVTTEAFPINTDLGEMAFSVAQKNMDLTLDEIMFGAFGFESLHVTNQLVELNALDCLYQCGFPVGKKPKFDSKSRLRFVDVNLDKPAVRIYSDRALFRKIVASPNEVEVNNSVVLKGLDHNLTKSKSDAQRIDTFEAITGFFDDEYKENKYYSQDHSQRCEDTYLVTRHKISWSKAEWSEVDEFHGRVDIDCHTLFNARVIIFAVYLALQIAVTALDLAIQSGGQSVANAVVFTAAGVPVTVAVLRQILYVTSIVALAGLMWSMQFIGRGTYEIWGSPFEYVYQELMVRVKMIGLKLSDIREIEFRNDFISDIETLEALALEQLRREMLKNQTYDIEMMDDPLLETDDIIEIMGARYYITGITRTFRADAAPIMKLTVWLIWTDVLKEALEFVAPPEVEEAPTVTTGYGLGYGKAYGKEL